MLTLRRWEPFGHFRRFERDLDHFWGATPAPFFARPVYRGSNGHVLLDVYEDNDRLAVKAAVPGVKPEDLDVSVTDNVLVIKGETKTEGDVNGDGYLHRERSYGSFHRQITLRPDLDIDKAEASYEDGVLTISFPKKESSKPKSLKINVQKALSGKSGK